ncbi:hypothetical protein D3C87_1507470 [compost metagenome]
MSSSKKHTISISYPTLEIPKLRCLVNPLSCSETKKYFKFLKSFLSKALFASSFNDPSMIKISSGYLL